MDYAQDCLSIHTVIKYTLISAVGDAVFEVETGIETSSLININNVIYQRMGSVFYKIVDSNPQTVELFYIVSAVLSMKINVTEAATFSLDITREHTIEWHDLLTILNNETIFSVPTQDNLFPPLEPSAAKTKAKKLHSANF